MPAKAADKIESKPLALNGEPITLEAASEKIVAVYGRNRLTELISGLNNGTYGGASVAEGYIQIVKPAPEAPKQSSAPAFHASKEK